MFWVKILVCVSVIIFFSYIPLIVKRIKLYRLPFSEGRFSFGAGCSKALSCQTVCSVGIETITSIMKMNRK